MARRKTSGLVVVSQSRAKSWRLCPRQHFNRYTLLLERKTVSRPLKFGSVIHEMLEAFNSGKDPYKVLKRIARENRKLFAAEREYYGDIVEDARIIFEAYVEWYRKDELHYIRWKKQRAEHHFEIELAPGLIFDGTIDALARREDRLRFIVDHKTFSKLPSEDERWRNLQSAVYLKAAEMLGMRPFDGVCWNYIKSKAPTRPGINKDGSVSSQRIDTLPAVVRRVFKEHRIDPTEDKAVIALQRAEENVPNYFRREYVPVNTPVVEKLFADFVATAEEIAEDETKPKAKRKKIMCIDRHCSWCDFERLCRTELTEGDVSYVRRKEYGKSKYAEKIRDKTEA